MAKHQIKVRIICRDPIRVCLGYEAIEFGLQDKKQSLQTGMALSADEIAFDFTLNVEQQSDGTPNFTGPFAHGKRASRFVYLTYKGYDGETWQIYRRIKVSLSMITWSQVEDGAARRPGLAGACLRLDFRHGSSAGRWLGAGRLRRVGWLDYAPASTITGYPPT